MAAPRKPGNRRDNHVAARALAEWARSAFSEPAAEQIAESTKVTVRTLWNWKKALDTDTELSGLFRDRLNDLTNTHWADELDTAIRASITRMYELIRTSDDLREVTEAFVALSEVELTREVLHGAANAHVVPVAGVAAEGRTSGSTSYN